jgi:hypothetical protein
MLMGGAALAPLASCASSATTGTSVAGSTSTATVTATGEVAIDPKAWNFDSDNNVYWQIGLSYCSSPAAPDVESFGIYVPGAYFTGSANSDGTYTCSVNESGSVGDYTARTAPFVFPINSAGYSAQSAPTSYSYNGLSSYLSAGLIYVYVGFRGRNNGYDAQGNLAYPGGAPWGVTDVKAAIRTIRYNASNLPGNTARVFTFGHSGGGAVSSLLGATGDSELYTQYLNLIGAPLKDASGATISDATAGAMCWCPITALDIADEAYEWNMGQYMASGTRADGTFTAALSSDLAEQFAQFINSLGLKGTDGSTLSLSQSSSGLYTAGTYYDMILATIEESLNNFLSDTTFPYTPGTSTTSADAGLAGGDGGASGGEAGGAPSGSAPSGSSSAPSGSAPDASSSQGGSAPSGVRPDATGSSASSTPSGSGSAMMQGMTGNSSTTDSTTYETAQAYIDSLNSDATWITYNPTTNTAAVTSVESFVVHCKSASKDVCAFDSLSRSQAENMVFGNDESDALHFDAIISMLLAENKQAYAELSNWDSSYPDAYADDLKKTDHLGVSSAVRQNMYNPMYYVCSAYDGYGKSTPAAYWRIRTGINQGDTALTTEKNLALALAQNKNVKDVDFATVWGKGHTTAERTGSSTTNFITWVAQCCK